MASQQSHMPIRQSKIHANIKIANHLLITYSNDDFMKYSTNPYVEPDDIASILTLYQTPSQLKDIPTTKTFHQAIQI